MSRNRPVQLVLLVLSLVCLTLCLPAVVAPANAEQAGSVRYRLAGASIALGGEHTCAIVSTGAVRCWGYNYGGELGSTTNVGHAVATPDPQPPVPLGAPATALAAGAYHSCALLTEGSVRCWGLNHGGQLGSTTHIGTNLATPMPQHPVALGSAAIAIAAGDFHTCALLATGAVRCWGDNSHGQLGSAVNAGGDAPNPAPMPAVALGARAVALSAGTSHTCALLVTGAVRCWGDNERGQLASGTHLGDPAPNPTPQQAVYLGAAAIALSAGGDHTCALLVGGDVRCWGFNYSGELGSPANNGVVSPTSVPQPAVALGGPAVAVSAGSGHTCAVLASGQIRCWGRNNTGQLGSTADYQSAGAVPTPQAAVAIDSPAVAVASAWGFSCTLTVDARILCWGDDVVGQLGRSLSSGSTTTPMPDSVALTGLRVVGATRLAMTAQPSSDRQAPYRFTFRGQVSGPFVVDAATCTGTISVTVYRSTRRLLTKRVALGPDCRWRTTVGVAIRLLRPGRNSLTVRARLARTSNLAVAGTRLQVIAIR